MKPLKECKIKVDMRIFIEDDSLGYYQSWVCCMENVFYLLLCQVEQIFFSLLPHCMFQMLCCCYGSCNFFQENAEYIENWIHSRISHNRISRNLKQCCPGRYLLSCFDKGYDR